jgi:hypothetical protein
VKTGKVKAVFEEETECGRKPRPGGAALADSGIDFIPTTAS